MHRIFDYECCLSVFCCMAAMRTFLPYSIICFLLLDSTKSVLCLEFRALEFDLSAFDKFAVAAFTDIILAVKHEFAS